MKFLVTSNLLALSLLAAPSSALPHGNALEKRFVVCPICEQDSMCDSNLSIGLGEQGSSIAVAEGFFRTSSEWYFLERVSGISPGRGRRKDSPEWCG